MLPSLQPSAQPALNAFMMSVSDACRREFEDLARWWLARYSDRELAELARTLGVEDASTDKVAAWQERLLSRPRQGVRRR